TPHVPEPLVVWLDTATFFVIERHANGQFAAFLLVKQPIREVRRYERQLQSPVVYALVEKGGSMIVCDELGPVWCDHGLEPAEGGRELHPIARIKWQPYYVRSGFVHRASTPWTRPIPWRGWSRAGGPLVVSACAASSPWPAYRRRSPRRGRPIVAGQCG